MTEALAQAKRINTPVLMLCGEDDQIVSLRACRRFFDAMTCEKRWTSFPGMRHELHHEPVADEVSRLTVEWVSAHA